MPRDASTSSRRRVSFSGGRSPLAEGRDAPLTRDGCPGPRDGYSSLLRAVHHFRVKRTRASREGYPYIRGKGTSFFEGRVPRFRATGTPLPRDGHPGAIFRGPGCPFPRDWQPRSHGPRARFPRGGHPVFDGRRALFPRGGQPVFGGPGNAFREGRLAR